MSLPLGFVPPCLPTKASHPPSGELWLHEIKHDGFRVIARKDGNHVRLYSRSGDDLTGRFPLIVEAIAALRSLTVILDGEAVALDDDGRASFDRLRHRRHDETVFLYAFDLIERNGDDLRRDPLEVRKATLLKGVRAGLRFNEHIEADGPTVFAHACKMGLEGIVSKRKASSYRSGRSPDWLKSKNPSCAAVRREAEEDWGS
jgi:bifunctional non-homologous end joining protein LigD